MNLQDAVIRALVQLRPNRGINFPTKRTPTWAVNGLLEHLGFDQRDPIVLDPCCGDGEVVEHISRFNSKLEVFALDLDPKNVARTRERALPNVSCQLNDVLREAPRNILAPHFIISRPPKDLVTAYARRARELAPSRCNVCLLIPLEWLRSRSRRLVGVNEPDVIALQPRPHTIPTFGWVVWRPKMCGRWSVIEATHSEETHSTSDARALSA